MVSRRVKYAAIWGFWTAFGLFQACSEMYRSSLMKGHMTWPSALLSELGYAWWWAIITPLVLRFTRRYPIEARHHGACGNPPVRNDGRRRGGQTGV